MKRSHAKGSVWSRELLLYVLPFVFGACSGTVPTDLFSDAGSGGAAGGSFSGGAPAHGGSSPGGVSGATSGGKAGGTSGAAGRAGGPGGSAGAQAFAGTAGKPEPIQGGADGGSGSPSGGVESGGTSGASPSAGSGNLGTSGASGNGGSGGAESGSAGQGGADDCGANSRELCDGLDNDCDGEIDDGAECPNGCKGRAIGAHGYMFCLGDEESFADANAECGRALMHLAWIESADENAALVKAAEELGTSVERVWIGGTDLGEEGDWRWIDAEEQRHDAFWSGGLPKNGGEPVGDRYVNWGEGRPNGSSQDVEEDCLNVSLNRSGLDPGTWNDDVCRDPWPYVCEF